jgi:hypothetical protein
MLPLEKFRQIIVDLQSADSIPDSLISLNLLSDEIDLLYLFADNYRNEIWAYGVCYEYEESMADAQRASRVAIEIYDHYRPVPYDQKIYLEWDYADHAMLYKYLTLPGNNNCKPVGEAGREIADKYGFDDKWVGNFRKRVSKYSKPSERLKVPKRVWRVYTRMSLEKLPIPEQLMKDIKVIWKVWRSKDE